VRFLDELPAGTRPTQRAHDDWAAGQKREAPYRSMVGRLGGFVAVRTRAEAGRRARA